MNSSDDYSEGKQASQKYEKLANDMLQKTVNAYFKDVNHLIQDANSTIEKMINGQLTDINEVMKAVEKADKGLALIVEIRNKLESKRESTQNQV